MNKSTDVIKHLQPVISSISLTPKIRVSNKNGRAIFSLCDSEQKKILKQAARLLNEWMRPELPMNLYGYLKGRGEKQAFDFVYSKYLEGKYIVTADIHKFFPSICQKRMAGILRKNGIDRRILTTRYISNGRLRYSSGLITGLPTSPALASMYLKPIMDKLNFKGWDFIFFADNFFGFTDTEVEAEGLLASLKLALIDHSYYKRRLKLNTGAEKGPRIYAPYKTIDLLGAVISKDGILPNPKNGAAYYGQKIKSIRGSHA